MSAPSPARAVPAQEVPITRELVAGLLADQHPDLAHLPLAPEGAGWDNVIFRLGDRLCVRLPRRGLAAPLVLKELDAVPSLAARLSAAGVDLELPVPVRAGAPGRGYPWHWSVCVWTEGISGLETPSGVRDGAVAVLARFLGVLHAPAPPGSPANPFRDGGLDAIGPAVRTRLALVAGRADAAALADLWARFRQAPVLAGPRRWIHGDLHPGNLLFSASGALAAVIDFGDLCAGDPAVDLACSWQLFGPVARAAFRRRLPADDGVWLRAAGWALHFGLLSVATEGNDPAFVRHGEQTLAALLDDFADRSHA